MTDCLETLLSSMSNTFNSECTTNAEVDLTDDKTVKWRNLSKNQFASKDKDKKIMKVKDNDNTISSSNNSINGALPNNSRVEIKALSVENRTKDIKEEEHLIKNDESNDKKEDEEQLQKDEDKLNANVEKTFKELLEDHEPEKSIENVDNENVDQSSNAEKTAVSKEILNIASTAIITNVNNLNQGQQQLAKCTTQTTTTTITTTSPIKSSACVPSTTSSTYAPANDKSEKFILNILENLSDNNFTQEETNATTTIITTTTTTTTMTTATTKTTAINNTTTTTTTLTSSLLPSTSPSCSFTTHNEYTTDVNTTSTVSACSSSSTSSLALTTKTLVVVATTITTPTTTAAAISTTTNTADNAQTCENINPVNSQTSEQCNTCTTVACLLDDAVGKFSENTSKHLAVDDVAAADSNVPTTLKTKDGSEDNPVKSEPVVDNITDEKINKSSSRSASLSPQRRLRGSCRSVDFNIDEEEHVQKSHDEVSNEVEENVEKPVVVNNVATITLVTPIRRGRGRARKVDTNEGQESQPKELTANEISPSNERKVGGRKRKQNDEDNDQLGHIMKYEEEDGKCMRRSVRLGNRLDGFKILEEEQKVESVDTLKAVESSQSDLKSLRFAIDEKVPPRKRGRKAKVQIEAEKLLQRQISNNNNNNNNTEQVSPHGHNIMSNKRGGTTLPVTDTVVPKRSQRRIKPTTKILENDELRYEFETKNIERITAQVWENSELNETTPTHQISGAGNNSASLDKYTNSSKQRSEKSDGSNDSHPSGTNAIKKKLFAKTKRDLENSGAALDAAQNSRKLCPDIDKFLHEIKTAKLNLNRSPEDRKLSKKQQRKLAKQKEKHLEKLGLRRNGSDDGTDLDSLSDSEEFVPTTRVQVPKPSVTLRIRTGKEATPQPQLINNTKSTNSVTMTATSIATSTTTTTTTTLSTTARRTQRQKLAEKSVGINCQQPKTLNNALESTGNVAINSSSATVPGASNKPARSLICLCQKSSNYYTRNTPETQYCCAIDNIDEQKVGCCNQLNGEILQLFRPSQRVGYLVLCDDHKKRLQSHNSCAGCGIFCTQGKFTLCKHRHFFHPECAQKFIINSKYDPQQPAGHKASPTLVLKCPHCGVDTPERTSMVTMKCQTLPVFSTTQRSTSLQMAGIHNSNGIQAASLTMKATTATLNTNVNSTNGCIDNQSGQTKLRTTTAVTSLLPPPLPRPMMINYEQLIPESVMNVAVRRQSTASMSRNKNAVEFTTRDMYYAIENDDLERVAEILASNYDVATPMREFFNGTCLHLVAHFGTLQMAYLLLCKAANPDVINVLDRELRTAVMCAVKEEKCDLVNLFAQSRADLAVKGPDGRTVLHIAAQTGNLEITQLLVFSYKASKNISNFLSFINAQDDGGWTAMVWAAELGHTGIVSLLLQQGADPNICDNDNNTVLHWAALHNNDLDTITILLQAGINCNIQNIEGETPLHIACHHSSTRLCIALIANGADLLLRNRSDELPYDCIPNEDSECARTVGFNMQMRAFHPRDFQRTRIVCGDISNGRELRPIQALRNDINFEGSEGVSADESDQIMWPDFRYITDTIILQNSVQIDKRVSQMRICTCMDGCSTDQCQCTGASVQCWYTAEGRLCSDFNYDDPALIFECNDVCGCNKLSCKNRVVQNGVRIPLQVIECEDSFKGWGVRSLIPVPKGSFVAGYVGEILTDLEADRRMDDSYFFDLGHNHCIDANYYGNVSRFFNHSCEPNIIPVRVFYEHQDYRFPKIAFFTCREIEAGEEICFDYGDKFWLVKNRYFSCKCLTPSCRYSHKPLENGELATDSVTTSNVGNINDVTTNNSAIPAVVVNPPLVNSAATTVTMTTSTPVIHLVDQTQP
ncbi:histone-lysine N-methyltransferase G9a [Glossina fuscipes fuscipes]